MTRLDALVAEATATLAAAGIEAAGFEAGLLACYGLGLSRHQLITDPEMPVDAVAAATVAALVERRVAHEPVAYITGRKGFWNHDFRVGPGVLIPRPDSETLVEAVLGAIDADGRCDARLRLLDLGVGSGCLLLSLLCELPAAFGVGVDISPQALSYARTNARGLGLEHRVELVEGDGFAAPGLRGGFDVILSNPPYIADREIAGLDADVRDFEPHLALGGGEDGLVFYRRIIGEFSRHLRPAGLLALEIGHDQGSAVLGLLAYAGLSGRIIRDLGRRDRVVVAVL